MKSKRRSRMIFKTIKLKYHLKLRREIPYEELLEIRRSEKEELRQISRQGCAFVDNEDMVINTFKIIGSKKITTRKRPRRGRDYKTYLIYWVNKKDRRI